MRMPTQGPFAVRLERARASQQALSCFVHCWAPGYFFLPVAVTFAKPPLAPATSLSFFNAAASSRFFCWKALSSSSSSALSLLGCARKTSRASGSAGQVLQGGSPRGQAARRHSNAKCEAAHLLERFRLPPAGAHHGIVSSWGSIRSTRVQQDRTHPSFPTISRPGRCQSGDAGATGSAKQATIRHGQCSLL